MRKLKPFFIFYFLLLLASAVAQKQVPELWGLRVHDEAHALSTTAVDGLEKKLEAFEKQTSNQVAILIVSSLEGDAIEDYALRVAEKWQLGRKDKSNGVLLLVAVDDHQMRIEVGQGLEGVLTDAQCNRIIRNDIAPHFRREHYEAGVQAGIESIIKTIKGEYTANDVDGGFDIITRIVVGIAVFLVLGIFTTVSLMLLEGKAFWWAYLGMMPFYIAFPWIAIGVTGGIILFMIYLIGYPIAGKWIERNNKKQAATPRSPRDSDDSGFPSSGSSGSSFGSSWSGSSGGGSFSGGGGSFGGGGSSGRW